MRRVATVRRAVVVAITAVFVGRTLIVQTAEASPPLPTDIDKFLQSTIADAQQKYGFPAAAAAIITSKDIHVVAMGVRRIDRPDRVTLDDRFGLGSNTKAITATMLGALVERNQLRWDVDMATAFPKMKMRPEYRAVTLRQILTHRGGLQPWTRDEDFERAKTFVTTDLASARVAYAETVLAQPPVNVPGTETRYSNADFS